MQYFKCLAMFRQNTDGLLWRDLSPDVLSNGIVECWRPHEMPKSWARCRVASCAARWQWRRASASKAKFFRERQVLDHTPDLSDLRPTQSRIVGIHGHLIRFVLGHVVKVCRCKRNSFSRRRSVARGCSSGLCFHQKLLSQVLRQHPRVVHPPIDNVFN